MWRQNSYTLNRILEHSSVVTSGISISSCVVVVYCGVPVGGCELEDVSREVMEEERERGPEQYAHIRGHNSRFSGMCLASQIVFT